MQQLKLFRALFLCILSSVLLFSCKKENKNNPDPAASKPFSMALYEKDCYQYGTILITSTQPITAFNDKVTIAGKELKAAKLNDTAIGLILPPEISGGNHKLALDVNGDKHFELDIIVKELPKVTNPDAVFNNYIIQLAGIEKSSTAAYDSICKRTGTSPTADYAEMRKELKASDDTIAKYVAEFNNLTADEKLIAASHIEAGRLKILPVLNSLKELNDEIIAEIGFGKKADCVSERHRRLLNVCEYNTALLQIRLLDNILISAAVGATVGTLVGPPLGTAIGLKVGIGAYIALNIHAIHLHQQSLNNAMSISFLAANQETLQKAEFFFNNNQATPISFKIVRRTLEAKDETSEYNFIKSFLFQFKDFNKFTAQYLGKWIKTRVKYTAPKQKSYAIEDIAYLSVSVSNNPKVSFVSLTGTASNPKLNFKTDENSEQSFKFKIVYDDGVFKQEREYDGKLTPTMYMTLNDSTLDYTSQNYFFDVVCGTSTAWTLSTNVPWMLVTRTSFTGSDRVQLGLQENKDGAVRTGKVTLNGNNKTIVVTITQNPACTGTLNVALARTGKIITATATGGKAPYQYSFIGLNNFASANTYTLVYDGYYRVIVKDANGCTDTASDCVNDVTNLAFTAAGWHNYSVKIKITYKSTLGLIPPFIQNNNKNFALYPLRGVNIDNSFFDVAKHCANQIVPGWSIPSFYSESGTNFDKVLIFSQSVDKLNTPTSFTFRIEDRCNGQSMCPDGSKPYFSPEYTLTW